MSQNIPTAIRTHQFAYVPHFVVVEVITSLPIFSGGGEGEREIFSILRLWARWQAGRVRLYLSNLDLSILLNPSC